ncbi:MAG: transketolase C-terminal domain-containing protein [bacterium]|jgi:1-deoxy-D-xylulose-5-phosphate synthase|nr:transketolase C-terminal domain-containing protein [bacterium]
MDRAGLVGEDGPSHHGVFDLSFLSMLPNAVVCAPKDGNELRNLMHMAYAVKDKAVFIRYPRANTHLFNISEPVDIPGPGSWEILRQGKRIALLAYGSMVNTAEEVCTRLEANKTSPTLVNARFLKPYDKAMLDELAKEHGLLVTLEEAAPRGGLRDTVLQHFQDACNAPRIHSFSLPDDFVTHGSRDELMKEVKLNAESLCDTILRIVK